ncbi:hypothetical protein TWF106_009611 [Orbilia oligospora]|uniref:Uncharacterized protein n=1 Tax=Orbilia oligospora TaxID=2813651 RepID=A0A7C8UEM0_ORBOL|nr:hypothetical protein TWF106_009611 [Orbilia oligospora]
MRFTSFLLLIGVASAAVPSVLIKSCNANNCLRAIAATAPVHLTRRQSEDCSSFFQSYSTSTTTDKVTHTPRPETVTKITGFDAIGIERCTPAPAPTPPVPTFPNYVVSGCTGTAQSVVVSRFSSACSCIGVRETAPVVTVTQTIEETTTAAGVETAVATAFHIKVRGKTPPLYLYILKIDGDQYGTAFTENINDAVEFSQHADGGLNSEYGQVAPYFADPDIPIGGVYYGDPNDPVFYVDIESLTFNLENWESGDRLPGQTGFETFAMSPPLIDAGFPSLLLAGKKGIDWAPYVEDGFEVIQLQAVPIAPEC